MPRLTRRWPSGDPPARLECSDEMDVVCEQSGEGGSFPIPDATRVKVNWCHWVVLGEGTQMPTTNGLHVTLLASGRGPPPPP